MARQNISTGSSANDGTGDTLRQAAQKINETFVEIYQKFGGDSDILSPVVSFDNTGIKINLGNSYTLTAAAPPAADRTIFLPDANGTAVLDASTQTLTNKTLTSPIITTPRISSSINDSNNDEIIKLTPSGSAVNEITISNASTTNKPIISATGTDTNITLSLVSKGTGSVEIDKMALSAIEITSNGAVNSTVSYIICNKSTALALTLADGTLIGEYKVFTNKGTGIATVTPSNFAQGTAFALDQFDTASIIWDGTNWYLTGDYGVTVS